MISGHKPRTISRTYGEGLDMAELAEAMGKISFPTFPHVQAGKGR